MLLCGKELGNSSNNAADNTWKTYWTVNTFYSPMELLLEDFQGGDKRECMQVLICDKRNDAKKYEKNGMRIIIQSE